MQADEIIQAKEWHQLNADEKIIVSELVTTVQEYNLLKKMLQVSGEATTEVPAISMRVKEAVASTLAKPAREKSRIYWWYAAAAIFFIVLALFIFQKREDAVPYVKNVNDTIESAQPVIVKQEPVKQSDTITAVPVKRSFPVKINDMANASTKKDIQKARVDTMVPLPQQQIYALVNTTIAAQKELLDLVTELY